MKILFLVYHGFSDYSGISKKIHYQVKGLRENGHDVRLCYYAFSPEAIVVDILMVRLYRIMARDAWLLCVSVLTIAVCMTTVFVRE